MSLLKWLFRSNKAQVFDPRPQVTDVMPARPYKVVHASVPFYSDADCRTEVRAARLIMLRCEDQRQTHRPIECMPTLKEYSAGQVVTWELNKDALWEAAWFRHPVTGATEKAWSQAVEFTGKIVRGHKLDGAESGSHANSDPEKNQSAV